MAYFHQQIAALQQNPPNSHPVDEGGHEDSSPCSESTAIPSQLVWGALAFGTSFLSLTLMQTSAPTTTASGPGLGTLVSHVVPHLFAAATADSVHSVESSSHSRNSRSDHPKTPDKELEENLIHASRLLQSGETSEALALLLATFDIFSEPLIDPEHHWVKYLELVEQGLSHFCLQVESVPSSFRPEDAQVAVRLAYLTASSHFGRLIEMFSEFAADQKRDGGDRA